MEKGSLDDDSLRSGQTEHIERPSRAHVRSSNEKVFPRNSESSSNTEVNRAEKPSSDNTPQRNERRTF
ncbi:hypothetical protein GQ53DRAFT_742218, partial [Thozetella sp. PMI_491]